MLVKRIMRYFRETSGMGLRFTGTERDILTAYSDADWAGNADEQKSISGYVLTMSSSAVCWKSKKQTIVALSTAEAEYVDLSFTTQEVTWLKKLLSYLGEDLSRSTNIHKDNQSSIAIATYPVNHNRYFLISYLNSLLYAWLIFSCFFCTN